MFEGEGSINPKQNVICLSSTDKDVVEKFAAIAGFGTVKAKQPGPKQLGTKTQYKWHVNRQEYTQALLAAFWPWLGVRRKAKAEEFFHHMATAYLRRIHRGESNYKAKLTADDVRFIRSSSEKGRSLAQRFGVTETNISSIRKFQTWRHLDVAGELHGP